LTPEVLNIALHPRAVSVVNKLREVPGSDNAKLSNFRERMNLGIPQRIGLVSVGVGTAEAFGKNRLDAFFAGERRTLALTPFLLLAVAPIGQILIAMDSLEAHESVHLQRRAMASRPAGVRTRAARIVNFASVTTSGHAKFPQPQKWIFKGGVRVDRLQEGKRKATARKAVRRQLVPLIHQGQRSPTIASVP
jgi:hypothetical protein